MYQFLDLVHEWVEPQVVKNGKCDADNTFGLFNSVHERVPNCLSGEVGVTNRQPQDYARHTINSVKWTICNQKVQWNV